MRVLPGRDSRSSLAEAPRLSRDNVKSDQHRRILRATAELVAKRGYNDVTVELIVKRARVSFKTFYKHFAGKPDAYRELFDDAAAAVEAEVRAALATSRPWPEQIAVSLRTFFAMIAAEPLIARACIVEGPTAGAAIFVRYARATRAFAPLLSVGRRHASPAVELPATLEDTISGAILWFAYQRLILGEGERMPELLPEAVVLVLRPYLGEEAAAAAARQLAQAEAG
jgi:AcrR family transcriptional regulator